MTLALTRRRFLSIAAATCGTRALGAADAAPQTRWRGRALGADASLQIVGMAEGEADSVLRNVQQELSRLEDIFSLYRPGSVLSRLNDVGLLAAPPPELLAVLSLCDRLHRATEGAFDPTVQSLFAAHARARTDARVLDSVAWRRAHARIGWDRVRFDEREVRLDAPQGALTLNGVAQGYITDRIASLLRSFGLRDVLVDMGEIAALGRRTDGTPWRAGIVTPEGMLVDRLTLSDRALATSAPKGTMLDPENGIGHIFDPATGRDARANTLVAVSAPTAALADGLSTALCVVPPVRHAEITGAFPGARIETAV